MLFKFIARGFLPQSRKQLTMQWRYKFHISRCEFHLLCNFASAFLYSFCAFLSFLADCTNVVPSVLLLVALMLQRCARLSSVCLYNAFWLNGASYQTRSQAVARIADRTASQHLWGHVTSSVTWQPMPFPIGSPLKPSLYL